jgi:hypothetical protein
MEKQIWIRNSVSSTPRQLYFSLNILTTFLLNALTVACKVDLPYGSEAGVCDLCVGEAEVAEAGTLAGQAGQPGVTHVAARQVQPTFAGIVA